MTGLEPLLIAAGASAATASAVSTAATVATIGLGVAGSYATYQGQRQAARDQNAQIDLQNRQITEQNAVNLSVANANAKSLRDRGTQELAVASRQAEYQRRKSAYLVSQQRAQFAASGGGLGGSAAEIMASTELQGDYNAELELWSGQEKKRGADYQGDVTIAEAKASQRYQRTDYARGPSSIALGLNVGSQILSGLSKSSLGDYKTPSGGAVISDDYDASSGWRTTTTRASPFVYG